MADLLIVDDDLDSAEALADILRAEGHEVRVGYDGREGLRLAGERYPDAALLDVEMPHLDGPGMALQMFVHNMGLEKVPVILLSGIANLSRIAVSIGTPYFLPKPYRYERLTALLDRALTERVAPTPGTLGATDAK
jgi:DNA-binding NtrC family response regulator